MKRKKILPKDKELPAKLNQGNSERIKKMSDLLERMQKLGESIAKENKGFNLTEGLIEMRSEQ